MVTHFADTIRLQNLSFQKYLQMKQSNQKLTENNYPLDVLVVEDDETNMNFAKEAFQPLEDKDLITAHYASSKKEAEKVMDNNWIDVAICDLYIPNLDKEQNSEPEYAFNLKNRQKIIFWMWNK